jgi:hypothetical protein
MSQWYRDKDLLDGGIEAIIPADSTLDETVTRIMRESGLAWVSTPTSHLPNSRSRGRPRLHFWRWRTDQRAVVPARRRVLPLRG